LAIRLGHREASESALATALDADADAQRRIESLRAFASVVEAADAEPLLRLIRSDASEAVRAEAVGVLARVDDRRIAEPLIDLHKSESSDALKSQIRDALLGRRSSALQWLLAVDRDEVPAEQTPLEQIRRVSLLGDATLDKLVLKHWGKLDGATREEKLAEVRRLNNDLRAGVGDPESGRSVFGKRCAICHQLFGEGKKVGPDLTTANRGDRQALLVSLVDPSSVIRKEYVSLIVLTADGRLLTGIPVERSDSGITLVDSQGQATIIARGEIDSVRESRVSQMPDDLYRTLSPQELRDLFAWLQSGGPAK
jgi:putative heme-binding domain-containing protein